MARKARQRISYVLPLANSPGGHRLGVNGLAIDVDNSILYSGGRDGLICAWDLNAETQNNTSKAFSSSAFRSQTQAHTHWVNDIILTQSNEALVSASSDVSVKVWRPHAEESQIPTTIGVHSDYVKCLATPGSHSGWVASGGLDHKIRLWDLSGAGEKLCINGGEEENNAKGSVYALSVRGSVMASGGPESIVRLWDPRNGKRITKFVGHTDNIRDILINQDSDTVITASSDQTVKVWSITAGRCMFTLNIHNDSVWSLYSDHPQLAILYSSDRSGVVAKTDLRNGFDWDKALSLSVAQEHEGVNKMIEAGGHIWTATSSSSINRWSNIPEDGELHYPDEMFQGHRWSTASRSRAPAPSSPTTVNGTMKSKIPLSCVLKFPATQASAAQKPGDLETATTYSGVSTRRRTEVVAEQELGPVIPFQRVPEETIEGQHGLIKHVILNDKRRVLTTDTAGEVMMWDLLKCVPIESFGKRHLEDVALEVNTVESVANWCGVDTRTGRLACILEENYCFDAEMYADELEIENASDFKDDQRINLGKWILRYLFANLIDEEILRDEDYRRQLMGQSRLSRNIQRSEAPPSIQLPTLGTRPWLDERPEEDSQITPRAPNGNGYPAVTPGLVIGVATPHPDYVSNSVPEQTDPPASEEGARLEKKSSQQTQSRASSDKSRDYFSANPNPPASSDHHARPLTPEEDSSGASTQSPVDGEKEEKPKEGTTLFGGVGKRFRMNFPKKLGRTSVEVRPTVIDDKAEESDKSEEREERIIQGNFFGTIQKLRYEYDERLQADSPQALVTAITPSLLNETPLLKPPLHTTIIIQEDRPDSGGAADLYRGTVRSAGHDADLIEHFGPMWLGDLLLRNLTPPKEIAKVAFVLLPYQDLLPSISADGNSRLNANRMLRAKKILAYVAERIEPQSEHPDLNALKPEDYLELYCQDKLVSVNTTLATLRALIWKTNGDVVLYYKSNGKKPGLDRRIPSGESQSASVTEGIPF